MTCPCGFTPPTTSPTAAERAEQEHAKVCPVAGYPRGWKPREWVPGHWEDAS